MFAMLWTRSLLRWAANWSIRLRTGSEPAFSRSWISIDVLGIARGVPSEGLGHQPLFLPLLEFEAQRTDADAQGGGGLLAVAVELVQGGHDGLALDLFEWARVARGVVNAVAGRRGQGLVLDLGRGDGSGAAEPGFDELGGDLAVADGVGHTGAEDHGPLADVLQFTHVAGP